jgi:hypothetical protein
MLPSATGRVWLGGTCLAVLALALGVCRPAVADDPQPGAVTLNAVIDTPSIYADDPLLLKCVLRNEGKQGVSVFGSFDPIYSTLNSGARIEVRDPDAKDFKPIRTIGEGRFCGGGKSWEFKSGQAIACYPQLGCLPKPGKWQVRVKMTTVDDKVMISQPVTVSVAKRPEKTRKLLEEYGSEIRSCMRWEDSVDAADLEKALVAKEALAGSELGRAITEAQLLRALRTAGAARARALALDDIKKHRDKLGPIAREYFDILTAQILIGHKDYDRAKPLLDAVPEPSYLRDRARAEIRLTEEKK